MNTNMQKLMKISLFFRALVLIGSASMLFFLVYEYVVNDELRRAASTYFYELWDYPDANKGILLGLQLPRLVTLFVGFYWLQRLLGHFQLGQFFGNEAMRCYLWLIWLKVLDIVLKITQELATAIYHNQFFEHTRISVDLDISNITTILLMLLIVYLLKAAREIEAENKEFI
ncbi:DUF2975 domain-containing protein [Pseudoalteromonas sp. C2R02]|uniref:DUF2975 domain-containing protein n=1 Tax=Pseudoalteromonas sp. C2R02 TaxID=2841565 RepID=UPI001C08D433|nr:DUF2975 domain-containing protein [Pseudoalteromonas sp. C2R02]MBU2971668.1 DUF2975 domain-containing protein [Pseudoalteromonas sp. C2R02]